MPPLACSRTASAAATVLACASSCSASLRSAAARSFSTLLLAAVGRCLGRRSAVTGVRLARRRASALEGAAEGGCGGGVGSTMARMLGAAEGGVEFSGVGLRDAASRLDSSAASAACSSLCSLSAVLWCLALKENIMLLMEPFLPGGPLQEEASAASADERRTRRDAPLQLLLSVQRLRHHIVPHGCELP